MTIDEARDHIGDEVVYHPYAPDLDPVEQGVITSVNDSYVYVRYVGDLASKGTAPELLTLLKREADRRPVPRLSDRGDLT